MVPAHRRALPHGVTDQQAAFIQAQLDTGHYASDSEVIREALREKELRMAEMEALRREIAVGWDQLDAGQVADFDPDAINRALDSEA